MSDVGDEKLYEFDEASLIWGRIQGYETALTMLKELTIEFNALIQAEEQKLEELYVQGRGPRPTPPDDEEDGG